MNHGRPRLTLAFLFLLTGAAQAGLPERVFELSIIVPESALMARLNQAEFYSAVFAGDPPAAAWFAGQAAVYREWLAVISAMKPKEL